MLARGSLFAGYRIEGVVGRGGMGVVYRGYDPGLGRAVALKLIAPELAADTHFRERFLRESRLAAAIEHPNVLPVYGAGEQDGLVYLAMRFVDGEDLGSRLSREGGLETAEAAAVASQLAAALDAAHAKGLVHRDVKPGNVLLDEDGRAYLADFGLTKPVAAGNRPTRTGELVGTLDYLAPEQIRAEAVDGRADQYALGCLVFHCLTGRPPFERESEAQMLWAHLNDSPPSLLSLRPELPAAIDVPIARALAKEPGERYGSCAGFVDSARSALGLDGRAVVQRRSRRGKLLIAVGALLVLGSVAAALALSFTGSGEPSAPASPAAVEESPAGVASAAVVEPNSVVVIDPGTSKVVATVPVGTTPTTVAFGDGAVWVVNADDRTVSRIDPETMAERRFAVGATPTDIAVEEGALWVANGFDGTVTRIDPETSLLERTIELPGWRDSPGDLDSLQSYVAVGAGSVWVADSRVHGVVWRIDSQTNAVVETIPLPLNSTGGAVAFGADAVWVAGGFAVFRIDPSTNDIAATIELNGLSTDDIAVGGEQVWAPEYVSFTDDEATVWRIDALRNVPERSISVGRGPTTGVAVGVGSVWAASGLSGTVERIDPSTNEVAETIELGASPRGIAVGGGSVWVAVG